MKYKYIAEVYKGNNVGTTGFNHREGVQIVATDDTGKRRYVFTVGGAYRPYKTPCLKLWEGVAHYKSGLNQRDAEQWCKAMQEAETLAKKWTAAGIHDKI